MMVEIDSAALRIICILAGSERFFKVLAAERKLLGKVCNANLAIRKAILNGHALAAFIPSALNLVCGSSPAPHKAIGEMQW